MIRYCVILVLFVLCYSLSYSFSSTYRINYKTPFVYIINKHDILSNINQNNIFIVRNFTDKLLYITPKYLTLYFGSESVVVHTVINEIYEDKTVKMKLQDFFRKYTEKVLYIKEDLDLMYKIGLHYSIDQLMRKYFTNKFIRYYFFWIGSKGSKTGIHKDFDDQSYLLQLYGIKKITIFRSNDDKIFKVRKKKEGSAVLSSIDYWKNNIDIDKKEIILHPGDILFIPSGWWHCAENITESIAVSCRAESLYSFTKNLYRMIK